MALCVSMKCLKLTVLAVSRTATVGIYQSMLALSAGLVVYFGDLAILWFMLVSCYGNLVVTSLLCVTSSAMHDMIRHEL